ncbi:MAG: Flagellar M-ring protein, partial [Pseudomonadota bacterium]
MAEQQILPAHVQIGAPAIASTGRWSGVLQFFRQPALVRALPAVALLGVVGLSALAWLALQAPAQTPLYAGLAEADKAAVAEALQASGIGYKLDPSSGALSVDA